VPAQKKTEEEQNEMASLGTRRHLDPNFDDNS
jgi:hypothetical protein